MTAPLDKETIRVVAAYLLDRADQYVDGSGCWVALADASHNLMRGDVEVSLLDGQLDPDAFRRVDAFARGRKKPRPVVPATGTEDHDE